MGFFISCMAAQSFHRFGTSTTIFFSWQTSKETDLRNEDFYGFVDVWMMPRFSGRQEKAFCSDRVVCAKAAEGENNTTDSRNKTLISVPCKTNPSPALLCLSGPSIPLFFDFLEIEKLHTWWSLVSFLNALAWSGIGFFCCFESRGKWLLGEVAGVFHGIYRRTVTKLCGLLDVVFWKADIFFTGVAVCLHSADWAPLLCFYSTVEENFLCGELVILSAFSCYFDSTSCSCESETEGGKGSTYLFKSQLCI